MAKVLRMETITRGILQANPHVLFLFGDNDMRTGHGGQAKEMRGEHNAIGIRTKKMPAYTPTSFWSDKDFEENKAKVDEDFYPVELHLARGGVVVIPAAGLGTGLANMGIRCPKTYLYLNDKIAGLGTLYGETARPENVGLRNTPTSWRGM